MAMGNLRFDENGVLTDRAAFAVATSEFKVKPREVEILEPLGDRIVVRPDAAEEMVGSLHVPDTAQQRPARGVIIAVGPTVELNVGDRILYGHFTGTETTHGGEEVLLMRTADVFAKITTVAVG